MTTACQADLPWPGTSPATASGTRMKPPWAIDEYASIRTMLVWRSAARLPNVMDAAARIQRIGCHESLGREEAELDDREQRDEAARLRRDRQERGDRGGRALVGVRRPEVEGHGADLEREPDQREEDPDREQRLRVGTARSG